MQKLFTAAAYIAWLLSREGDPYWYGTYFNRCTNDLLTRKSKQYPGHYGSSRTSRYRDDIAKGKIAGDCVGAAIKGAAWSMLGKHAPKYASNGVPDRSADGMFAWAKEMGCDWGAIKTIPDKPGVAVRFAGHVGIYIGNGRVFEWRGFAYGAVITTLKSRPWTHWYALPFVDYGQADKPVETPAATLGTRLLRTGHGGEDVRMLQTQLMGLGYSLAKYGADGQFGAETEAAVRLFQRAQGIGVDGKYGAVSHAALMSVLAERDRDEDDEGAPEPVKQIRVTGGTVYVRAGAGTQHKIITIVRKDDVLPWHATAANGWHATEVSGKAGWITGKYTTVE